MKVQARFFVQDSRLYALDGTEWPVRDAVVLRAPGCLEAVPDGSARLFCVRVPWSVVGRDECSYDERFLAAFRDWLKALEGMGRYVFIMPEADGGGCEADALAASFKHCARRVKDCVSVVGFAIPPELDAAGFMAELRQKHPHYIFLMEGGAGCPPDVVRL